MTRFTSPGGLACSTSGGADCDLAHSTIYSYYPPGVEWNCQDAADALGLPSCDPDCTELHDTVRPRLLNVPNHQMNDLFEDVPPYYRQ